MTLTLTEYSGQGECREVDLWNDTADRYREELRTWARSKNWKVSRDTNGALHGALHLEKVFL